MKNKIALWAAGILLALAGTFSSGALWMMSKADLAGNGLGANSCTPTHSIVNVGADLSTELLDAASNRAWARIQQPVNATNTPAVNLGSTAVAGQGMLLNSATSSQFTALELGLDTDLPYTGAIEMITDNGSTTALITECLFN